jgi:Heparinase II/III-like protein/Heparinase II/III N-terminus
MAVGLRAPYLAFVLRAGAMSGVVCEEDAGTLMISLRDHGRHLAYEENYAGGHNHGLFQDEGLLLLCESLPFLDEAAAWRDLAWLRCMKTLRETVNWEEGVHLEHSPAYHLAITHYVRRIVDLEGADKGELGGLLERLEDTAGWLVLPDGTLPQLGDTDLTKAAVWAVRAADGKDGLKLLAGSGLAVVKERDSFLIVSAWHHGHGHKHADELGFALYESERCVLGDAGRYGYYEDEPARQYARSSHAHNTLIVDDESFDWSSGEPYGSGIVAGGTGAGWHAIEGINPLLRDIDHRRLFLYSPGSVLIVVDEVRSTDPHAFSRLLHFGPGIEVETAAAGLTLRGDGFRGTVSDWNEATTNWELSHGQHEPERGWTYPRDREAVPVWTAELSTTGLGFTSAMAIAVNDEPVRVTAVCRDRETVRVSIDVDGTASEITATLREGTIEISQEDS